MSQRGVNGESHARPDGRTRNLIKRYVKHKCMRSLARYLIVLIFSSFQALLLAWRFSDMTALHSEWPYVRQMTKSNASSAQLQLSHIV